MTRSIGCCSHLRFCSPRRRPLARNGYGFMCMGTHAVCLRPCRCLDVLAPCLLWAAGLGLVGLAVSCNDRSERSGKSVRLTGAGATFPKPLYDQWAAVTMARRVSR